MDIKTAFMITTLALSACQSGERDNFPQAVERTAPPEKAGAYITSGSFTGGDITDGMDVHDIVHSVMDGFERIEIRIFEAKWGDPAGAAPAASTCRFTVEREEYPPRLVITLGGTRMFSASGPELGSSSFVRDFYRIIYLGDSGSILAFEIDGDSEFEVFEMRDPAAIVIDLRKREGVIERLPDEVYSLRSASWPVSERLGHLQEELMRAGAGKARILRDEKGEFCVEEGYYLTGGEVAARSKAIGGEVELFVESRGPTQTPRNISPGGD